MYSLRDRRWRITKTIITPPIETLSTDSRTKNPMSSGPPQSVLPVRYSKHVGFSIFRIDFQSFIAVLDFSSTSLIDSVSNRILFNKLELFLTVPFFVCFFLG